jgi:hypothetical protein
MMKEILELIAELARETAEWDGGSSSGVVYTSAHWRKRLKEIARKADELARKQP